MQFGFQFVGNRFWVYLKWDSTKKDPHNERSGVWCCQFFWPEGNLIRKCFFQTRYWMTLQQGAWHCLTYSPDIPIAKQKGSWRICDLYCLYYSATLKDNVSFATPHMNLGRMIPQWECLENKDQGFAWSNFPCSLQTPQNILRCTHHSMPLIFSIEWPRDKFAAFAVYYHWVSTFLRGTSHHRGRV